MKLIIIIASILLLALSACTSSYSFDEGEVTETDDSATLEFKPLEISDGLYDTEKVIIDKESNEVTLIHEFESDFFNGEHTYIMHVPKELAAHVDEVEFSVEPDTIINPDPEVSWFLELEEKQRQIITARMDLAGQSGGAEQKIVDAMEIFDSIRYFARIKQCARADGKEYECYHELLTKYREEFNDYDCVGAGGDFGQACKAFIHDVPEYCGDSGPCKSIYFHLESANCKNDDCNLQAAIKAKFKPGCDYVQKSELKTKCAVGISQDDSSCNDLLPDNEAYDNCCMAIEEESQRERCLAYNDDESAAEETSATAINSEKKDCESMKEGTWKNICFRTRSKRDCDVFSCLALADETKHRDCIMNMGSQCGFERCDYLEDEHFKIQCQASSATSAAECNQIEGEFKPLYSRITYNREYCLEQLT